MVWAIKRRVDGVSLTFFSQEKHQVTMTVTQLLGAAEATWVVSGHTDKV